MDIPNFPSDSKTKQENLPEDQTGISGTSALSSSRVPVLIKPSLELNPNPIEQAIDFASKLQPLTTDSQEEVAAETLDQVETFVAQPLSPSEPIGQATALVEEAEAEAVEGAVALGAAPIVREASVQEVGSTATQATVLEPQSVDPSELEEADSREDLGAALIAEDSLVEQTPVKLDFKTSADNDDGQTDELDGALQTTKSPQLTIKDSDSSLDKEDTTGENLDFVTYKPPSNFVEAIDSGNRNNQTNFNSFQTAAGNSLFLDCDKSTCLNTKDDEHEEDNMEFSKDYSVDSLMGGNQREPDLMSGTNVDDLADLELPPYSGSSSGASEDKQPREQQLDDDSPLRKNSSSSSSIAQTTASTIHSVAANASSSSSVASNLSAVKNLLLFNYSKVSHILHWRNPIETGVIFLTGATLILALTFFSIISVVAYTGLGLILGASLMRAYKAITKTFNMPSETRIDHIWTLTRDLNVTLSPGKMHELVDSSLGSLNAALVYIKQALIVEDKFATIALGLNLYVLTYIGSWFNGMTLITLTYLALFTLPIVYEKNKTKIDEYFNLLSKQLSSTLSTLTSRAMSYWNTSVSTSKRD